MMNTMSQIPFDEDLSRKVERIYTTPDVLAQRRQVLQSLDLTRGEHVLDIGSGPGLLAYDMALAVGPQGRVCGIDLSAAMIAMSAKRCADQPWVEFQTADAIELPYPDDAFDAAVSTQVYEYVSDIPAALTELHRVLRPGGRALILDTDYGSLGIHTEDPRRMARFLAEWDHHFGPPHLPRTLSRQLRDAGFLGAGTRGVPHVQCGIRRQHIRKKGMLAMMASFAVGRKGISQSEADAWFAEFSTLNDQGLFFFSLNRYLFVAGKPLNPGEASNQ